MPRLLRYLTTIVLLTMTAAAAIAAESAGTVLITGANRGIGLALAETFSEAGYSVIGTARKPVAATALGKLPVRVVQLDVTDPASVARLAREIGDEPIDILINNAGILRKEAPEFADVDIEGMVLEYQVNTLGPLRVAQALLPNVFAGERKTVVNISSILGSMELNTFGSFLGYRASKAALNSVTKTLAVNMTDQGSIFVLLHPGYVKTDMNDGEGAITVAQSVAGLYTVITGLSEADNGKFFSYEGKPMPW
jgi:NAD(P)-dependent dehydrogenase (short-subunit alcohol dehydrogenase family)